MGKFGTYKVVDGEVVKVADAQPATFDDVRSSEIEPVPEFEPELHTGVYL